MFLVTMSKSRRDRLTNANRTSSYACVYHILLLIYLPYPTILLWLFIIQSQSYQEITRLLSHVDSFMGKTQLWYFVIQKVKVVSKTVLCTWIAWLSTYFCFSHAPWNFPFFSKRHLCTLLVKRLFQLKTTLLVWFAFFASYCFSFQT